MTDGFIPAHGGYEDLLSYQRSVIVYDGTVRFCERFLNKYDRTVDQMVKAARSGRTLWDKNSKEALYVRKLASGRIPPPVEENRTDETKGTNEGGKPGTLGKQMIADV